MTLQIWCSKCCLVIVLKKYRKSKFPLHWHTTVLQKVGRNLDGLGFRKMEDFLNILWPSRNVWNLPLIRFCGFVIKISSFISTFLLHLGMALLRLGDYRQNVSNQNLCVAGSAWYWHGFPKIPWKKGQHRRYLPMDANSSAQQNNLWIWRQCDILSLFLISSFKKRPNTFS